MNLHELVQKYSGRGTDCRIAVGLRPSGKIHLGNIATIGLAGILGKEVGPHLSSIDLTVCDLDMPDTSDWSFKKHGFLKYFNDLPAPDGSERSLLNYALDGIDSYAHDLSEILNIPYERSLLSEVQRDEKFRSGLRKVLDTPGLMQKLIPQAKEGEVAVFPLCPCCGTSNPNKSDYHDGVISTACANPECSTEDYDAKIEDCDIDLAVHYFIDPLRDRLSEPPCDIHVFGGDYGQKNCHGLSKADKVLKATRAATGSAPDLLIGPTFYSSDGTKMSKSKNNGLTIGQLRRHFGSEYAQRTVDFAETLAKRGYNHVDYRVVEDRLLK